MLFHIFSYMIWLSTVRRAKSVPGRHSVHFSLISLSVWSSGGDSRAPSTRLRNLNKRWPSIHIRYMGPVSPCIDFVPLRKVDTHETVNPFIVWTLHEVQLNGYVQETE